MKNIKIMALSYTNKCSLNRIAQNEILQCVISYLLSNENKHFIIFKYVWNIDERDDKIMIAFKSNLGDISNGATLWTTNIHFILFILNSLYTVAPSTKSGCFSGGRGKNLITVLLRQIKKNIYNVKLE